ncbi:MAG: class I SAM-dependent methyltransferase [Rhodospirillales bacterium]
MLRSAVSRHVDRERLRGYLKAIGFDATHWVRVVAYREARAWLGELGIEMLDALEIAPGHYWKKLTFKTYRTVSFPAFDVCRDVLPERFDVIIADQVFEHVRTPWTAARNVCAMLRPGGHFLCFVPFLLKVHGYPDDCTRWTDSGLRWLLEDAGFEGAKIKTGSWGNRQCAVANLRHGWRMYGFGRSLKNDPDLPVMTWAFAQA